MEKDTIYKKVDRNDECLSLMELDILKRLKHENIIELLSFEIDIQKITYTFKLYEPLCKVISSKLESQRLSYVKQLCEAVNFLHKHDIFHGDLKPQNILLDGERLVLCDFNLSQYGFLGKPIFSQTLLFASPETIFEFYPNYLQFFNSESINYCRQPFSLLFSDLWSLGQCIYYLLKEDFFFSSMKSFSDYNDYLLDPKAFLETKCLGSYVELFEGLFNPLQEDRFKIEDVCKFFGFKLETRGEFSNFMDEIYEESKEIAIKVYTKELDNESEDEDFELLLNEIIEFFQIEDRKELIKRIYNRYIKISSKKELNKEERELILASCAHIVMRNSQSYRMTFRLAQFLNEDFNYSHVVEKEVEIIRNLDGFLFC
jgi:Serine/threonine protein kinase